MTEENAGGFDEILKRLDSMTRKPCSECGQVFRGLEEQKLCTECSYRKDHPEARDMHWTWSRAGRGSWGIAWPTGPTGNPCRIPEIRSPSTGRTAPPPPWSSTRWRGFAISPPDGPSSGAW